MSTRPSVSPWLRWRTLATAASKAVRAWRRRWPAQLVAGFHSPHPEIRAEARQDLLVLVLPQLQGLIKRFLVQQKRRADEAEELVPRVLSYLEACLRAQPPTRFRRLSQLSFQAALLLSVAKMLAEPQRAAPSALKLESQSLSSLNYNIRTSYRPCKTVGGDWIEVDRHQDGTVWVLVADVMGKDWPAHILANGLPHLWRLAHIQEGRSRGYQPTELMDLLDQELQACLPREMFIFVEMSLARIGAEGSATVTAQACPVVVRRQDQVESHTLGGRPPGLAPFPNEDPRKQSTIQLHDGDELILASDGLFDQPPHNRRFVPHIQELLQSPAPPKTLHDAVHRIVEESLANHPQRDDIAIVSIERGQSKPARRE